MLSMFTIRLFQFNWLLALMMVLIGGIIGNWSGMIIDMLLALAWAYLIQRFTEGEDLIATLFLKKKNKSENPTS